MTRRDLAASTSLALNVLKLGDSRSLVNSTEVKMLLGCKNVLTGEMTEANMVTICDPYAFTGEEARVVVLIRGGDCN